MKKREKESILVAIENHNRLTIDSTISDPATLTLCKLIRDADKCDIFRVFACDGPMDSMGCTVAELQASYISTSVHEQFQQHKPVDGSSRETPLDVVVMALAFFFDMNYDAAVRLAHSDGYYRQLLDILKFTEQETAKQVAEILNNLEIYLDERTTLNE